MLSALQDAHSRSGGLTADELRGVREAAVRAVAVPPAVIQLLADLRAYLQVRRAAVYM